MWTVQGKLERTQSCADFTMGVTHHLYWHQGKTKWGSFLPVHIPPPAKASAQGQRNVLAILQQGEHCIPLRHLRRHVVRGELTLSFLEENCQANKNLMRTDQ